jgi:hypothetical protein
MTDFDVGNNTTSLTQMNRSRNHLQDTYLLQGIRCYTNASTTHDNTSILPRNAGLGLFIINTQVQPAQTFYIKAKMTEATSVLMAEATAMALAAIITHRLNMQPIIFLSDNEQLVHFLNAPD